MNSINILRASIDTSIELKLYSSRKDSASDHIFNSSFYMFPLSKVSKLNNFNIARLQDTPAKAYPLNDRPRGNNDLLSVKYHQKQIKKNILDAIWIYKKNNKYTLLDGVHRIVATHIENKKYIPSYIIEVSK